MIKKRFKVEVHSLNYTCKFEVEIDAEQSIDYCYDTTNLGYIFDDVEGVRHMFSRENSLIEITPLTAKVTYEEKK
jgi:hypothetical protein